MYTKSLESSLKGIDLLRKVNIVNQQAPASGLYKAFPTSSNAHMKPWKAAAILFLSVSHGPSTQTPVFGADGPWNHWSWKFTKQCAFGGFKQLQLGKKMCLSSTPCNLQVERGNYWDIYKYNCWNVRNHGHSKSTIWSLTWTGSW